MDSVLEREQAPVQEMSEEEREHRRLMSERMRALLAGSEDILPNTSAGAQEYGSKPEAPVYRAYTEEHHAPVVPNSPDAPSAAKRLADFYVIKPGQPMRRFGDLDTNVTDYAPPMEQNLFGNILDSTIEASVYAPAAPAVEPAPSMPEAPSEAVAAPETSAEESEDAVPTRRTMLYRNVAEEQKGNFLSALSLKTKLVLAAVTAVIVLLLAVVCVNTAIINSMDRGVAEHEAELAELSRVMETIDSELGEITSPEYVEAWAAAHGMLG